MLVNEWCVAEGRLTLRTLGSVRYWSIGGSAGVPVPEGPTEGVRDMMDR